MSAAASRQDRLLGFALVLVVGLAGLAGIWRGLDGWVTESGMRLAPERNAGDEILFVDIDEPTLQELDDWEGLAAGVSEAINQADRGNARVMALVLPRDWGLGGPAADEALSRAVRNTDNLLLGLPYRAWPEGEARGLGERWRLGDFSASLVHGDTAEGMVERLHRRLAFQRSLPSGRLVPSFPGLVDRVGGVGFVAYDASPSELREPPALLRLEDSFVPALALHVAARHAGASVNDMRLGGESGVRVNGENYATTPGYRFHPHYYSADSGPERISLDTLLDQASPELFEDRAVIIGSSAEQWADRMTIPTGERLSPGEITARQTAALVNHHLYSAPDWMAVLPWAVLLVVGLYLAYVLPRIGLATSIAVTLLLAVILINVQLITAMARMLHLPLAMPVVALVGGHLVIWARQFYSVRRAALYDKLSETNRLLAESLQTQGRLDTAFDRYRECRPSPELYDRLYNLGLDFERRRQFARAQAVMRYLKELQPGFADVEQRIRKLGVLESKMALGGGKGGGRPLVLTEDGMQKPMLGRYEIQKEIGRGAMGTVYLGRDPRIGRTVAIKTVALSEEFEGEELERVTARFFREAETAGRLNHPSIVTIYDVGEEADLAYIAMDYLDGSSLSRYTRSGKLLPVPTVFDIVTQVAEALDYAHGLNVVHRDVKPGNMIYDRQSRRIKVTDFGVACLTDASKTKTGTILGTPSYMSPEQVLGKRVDGRSDLFSLGVSFFQLLRGELPFQGEPLATLMYKIANEPHPSVCELRLDLPESLGSIMDRLLAKKPEDRFQSGADLAAELKRCRREAADLARKSSQAGA